MSELLYIKESGSDYVAEYPLLEKFDAVFQNTAREVLDIYKQRAHSELGLQYAVGHAKYIINKFQMHFNRVSDLHKVIEYVKMKSKKFGRERIEYAKRYRLPEYDERLIDVCLRFLRNYYGELKCMKILLTN